MESNLEDEKLQQKLEELNKAIELNPNSAELYNVRGTVYFKKGNYKQAISEYKQAIEIEPDIFTAHWNITNSYFKLGINLLKQDNYKKAKFYFEELIKTCPTDPNTITKRYLTYIEKIEKAPHVKTIFDEIEKIQKVLEFTGGEIVHYTGLAAAKSLLIQKSELRFTEANYMNDTSEGTKLYNYLFDDEKTDETIFTEKPFFVSFVNKENNNNLTMWRTYAKTENIDGCGCSITVNMRGIKSLIMKSIEKDQNPKTIFNRLNCYKIAYLNEENKVIETKSNNTEEVKKLNDSIKIIKENLDNIKKFRNKEKREKTARRCKR